MAARSSIESMDSMTWPVPAVSDRPSLISATPRPPPGLLAASDEGDLRMIHLPAGGLVARLRVCPSMLLFCGRHGYAQLASQQSRLTEGACQSLPHGRWSRDQIVTRL